jgi:pyruvate/2-oxoglutarate dehydrogenase complex dihydrolipoamide acyltransferase (E2) component
MDAPAVRIPGVTMASLVRFEKLENPSSFRKLAAAMWAAPNDPHIFGFLDVDATPVLTLMERYEQRTGTRVSVTHVVTRALALVLARHPEVNAKVGWAHILQRSQVDIFCQVSTDRGKDLSGAKIPRTDTLSLAGIAEALRGSAQAIREGKDPSYERSRALFRALPLWGLRGMLWVLSLLNNTLNLHLPRLGMPRDAFGSAMVTSVGMLGIDSGFAPFTPLARCPIIITVTRIKKRPWVVDDEVVARPVLRLCGTFDHRVIDGYHAGQLCAEIEALMADPEGLLTPEERERWERA